VSTKQISFRNKKLGRYRRAFIRVGLTGSFEPINFSQKFEFTLFLLSKKLWHGSELIIFLEAKGLQPIN